MNDLIRLAISFEKKYQRVDQDPDTLNQDDPGVDPHGVIYPREEDFLGGSPANPRVSENMAETLFVQIWPRFIAMSKEEQRKFLTQLAKHMGKL